MTRRFREYIVHWWCWFMVFYSGLILATMREGHWHYLVALYWYLSGIIYAIAIVGHLGWDWFRTFGTDRAVPPARSGNFGNIQFIASDEGEIVRIWPSREHEADSE